MRIVFEQNILYITALVLCRMLQQVLQTAFVTRAHMNAETQHCTALPQNKWQHNLHVAMI